MKTGFVILNYNSWEIAKVLAEKVSSFDCVNYVVVVDNASTDDSYKNLGKICDEKIIVKQSANNNGYSCGNNIGAQILAELNVEIMFIANPDIEIEKEDIQLILDGFKQSKDFSILSGVEYDIEKQITQPVIWNLNRYYDDLQECFYTGRILKKKRTTTLVDYNKRIQEIDIIKGSFFAIRMDDFFQMDKFDENVFLFCEERILSAKAKRQNKKIGLVTSAKYFHNHSFSINKEYRKKYRQMKLLYNSRLYFNKTYNKAGFIKMQILRISMAISLIEFFIAGKFRELFR